MRLEHGIGLVGVLTLLGAGVWLGCDDTSTLEGNGDAGVPDSGSTDGGGNRDTGGGNDGGGTDAGSDSASDDGSVERDGSVDAGDAGPPTCSAYCQGIAAACTGANAQYATDQQCLNACKLFPVGSTGETSGNTLACRIYHTKLAVSASPVPHCLHAGPYGFGGCGDEKDNFCALALGYCSADGGFTGTAPYATLAECTTAAGTFAHVDAGASPSAFSASGPTSGNTFDCREYHLITAFKSSGPAPSDQATHCNHPGVVSTVCQ